MLYDHIIDIQRKQPSFNRKPLSVEDLISWCGQLGGKVIEDRRSRHPSAYWDEGPVIRLNTSRSEALLVVILGHEMGHILLGHLGPGSSLPFSVQSLFKKDRWERDASIIGYLSLIPTSELIRMVRYGIQGPEELFSELQPMFGDDEKVGMQICTERIRIFNDLLAVCGGRCLEGGDCHVCEDAPTQRKPVGLLDKRVPDDGCVVYSPFELQPGEEYRLRNDREYVVRIRFKSPVTGKQIRLFACDVPVTGISFHDVLENAAAFIAGRNRSLVIERDPGNRHDPNAIRVIGRWRDAAGSEQERQIGWVPKDIAARIASQAAGAPIYGALQTLFRPDEGRNPGIRFGIWV